MFTNSALLHILFYLKNILEYPHIFPIQIHHTHTSVCMCSPLYTLPCIHLPLYTYPDAHTDTCTNMPWGQNLHMDERYKNKAKFLSFVTFGDRTEGHFLSLQNYFFLQIMWLGSLVLMLPPVIPALGKLRQVDDSKFETSFSYIVNSSPVWKNETKYQ